MSKKITMTARPRAKAEIDKWVETREPAVAEKPAVKPKRSIAAQEAENELCKSRHSNRGPHPNAHRTRARKSKITNTRTLNRKRPEDEFSFQSSLHVACFAV